MCHEQPSVPLDRCYKSAAIGSSTSREHFWLANIFSGCSFGLATQRTRVRSDWLKLRLAESGKESNWGQERRGSAFVKWQHKKESVLHFVTSEQREKENRWAETLLCCSEPRIRGLFRFALSIACLHGRSALIRVQFEGSTYCGDVNEFCYICQCNTWFLLSFI